LFASCGGGINAGKVRFERENESYTKRLCVRLKCGVMGRGPWCNIIPQWGRVPSKARGHTLLYVYFYDLMKRESYLELLGLVKILVG
jgi:hypothetical protein